MWIPKSPERAGGEQAGDLVRDRADAELQRGALVDERRGVPRDGDLLGRRRLGREDDEVVVVLDPGVHLGDVDAVVAVLREPGHARHARVHLGDGEAVGVARRLQERRCTSRRRASRS